MKYSVQSSVGCIRQYNQDFYHIPKSPEDIKLCLIADGMGGTKGGEIASSLATSAAVTHIIDHYADTSEIPRLLRDAVKQSNTAVFRTSRMQPELNHMGTTMTLVLIKNGLAYIAQVGDSRAYIINDEGLRQITVDHSYVQELVNAGEITKEMARNHPERHKITRAIGVHNHVPVDIFMEPFGGHDRLLLCSDGLTSMVDDATINQILKSEQSRCAAEKLVKAAEQAGGYDNITVILIEND